MTPTDGPHSNQDRLPDPAPQRAPNEADKCDETSAAPAPQHETDADADERATTPRAEAIPRATTSHAESIVRATASRDDADARSRRRMIAAISLMLVLFALVVTFRREIRVRWWANRLMATQDIHERAYYLGLLAMEPQRSAPAAERLIKSDDATLRSFGVALAVRMPGPRGDVLLERALHDADPVVRDWAIEGFSTRPSPDVVPTLRALINSVGTVAGTGGAFGVEHIDDDHTAM